MYCCKMGFPNESPSEGDFSKLGAKINKGAKGGGANLNFWQFKTYRRYSWVVDEKQKKSLKYFY